MQHLGWIYLFKIDQWVVLPGKTGGEGEREKERERERARARERERKREKGCVSTAPIICSRRKYHMQ